MVMAFEEPGGGPPMVEFISSAEGKVISNTIEDEEWLRLLGKNVSVDDPSFHEIEIY